MFIDFILLWSAALPLIKFGHNGYISVDTAAFLFIGATVVVTVTRMMGSAVFRERSRIPKFLLSLGFFALLTSDGDYKQAIKIAVLTMAFPITSFGLYLMIRSLFRKM